MQEQKPSPTVGERRRNAKRLPHDQDELESIPRQKKPVSSLETLNLPHPMPGFDDLLLYEEENFLETPVTASRQPTAASYASVAALPAQPKNRFGPTARELLNSPAIPIATTVNFSSGQPTPHTRCIYVFTNKPLQTVVMGVAKMLHTLGLGALLEKMAGSSEKFQFDSHSRFKRNVARVNFLPGAPTLSVARHIGMNSASESTEGIYTPDTFSNPETMPGRLTFASTPVFIPPSDPAYTSASLETEIRTFFHDATGPALANRIVCKLIPMSLHNGSPTPTPVVRMVAHLPPYAAVSVPRARGKKLVLTHIPPEVAPHTALILVPTPAFAASAGALASHPLTMLQTVPALQSLVGAIPILHPIGQVPVEFGLREGYGGIVGIFNQPEMAAGLEHTDLQLLINGIPFSLRAESVPDWALQWVRAEERASFSSF
jgi:hypothetical protein